MNYTGIILILLLLANLGMSILSYNGKIDLNSKETEIYLARAYSCGFIIGQEFAATGNADSVMLPVSTGLSCGAIQKTAAEWGFTFGFTPPK